MKTIAKAALGALALASLGVVAAEPANAQGFGFSFGTGLYGNYYGANFGYPGYYGGGYPRYYGGGYPSYRSAYRPYRPYYRRNYRPYAYYRPYRPYYRSYYRPYAGGYGYGYGGYPRY